MNTQVPHPIPYQGSKRRLANQIFCHFPSDFERLIEPFAGSAAISLAAAKKRYTSNFLINDAHQPLIDLWKEIIHRPHKLADNYEMLWSEQLGDEKNYYNYVRGKFNQHHEPHHFLYLLARCVKAAIRYNPKGEFNNSPDNRRKGARPESMRARILGASHLLRGRTQIECCDYREILRLAKGSDLIYMDPPYQGVCAGKDNRYNPTIVHDEFVQEIEVLVNQDKLFIISYDGRLGDVQYGESMPESLGLLRLDVNAGRSTQATLLGRSDVTVESLYLSPALCHQLSQNGAINSRHRQLELCCD